MSDQQLVHRNCGGAITIWGQYFETGERKRMVYVCRACGAHSDVFTDSSVVELDLAHAGPLAHDEVGDFLEGAPSRVAEKAS